MFYVGAISNERRYRKQPKKTTNFEHLKVQVFIYIYVLSTLPSILFQVARIAAAMLLAKGLMLV